MYMSDTADTSFTSSPRSEVQFSRPFSALWRQVFELFTEEEMGNLLNRFENIKLDAVCFSKAWADDLEKGKNGTDSITKAEEIVKSYLKRLTPEEKQRLVRDRCLAFVQAVQDAEYVKAHGGLRGLPPDLQRLLAEEVERCAPDIVDSVRSARSVRQGVSTDSPPSEKRAQSSVSTERRIGNIEGLQAVAAARAAEMGTTGGGSILPPTWALKIVQSILPAAAPRKEDTEEPCPATLRNPGAKSPAEVEAPGLSHEIVSKATDVEPPVDAKVDHLLQGYLNDPIVQKAVGDHGPSAMAGEASLVGDAQFFRGVERGNLSQVGNSAATLPDVNTSLAPKSTGRGPAINVLSPDVLAAMDQHARRFPPSSKVRSSDSSRGSTLGRVSSANGAAASTVTRADGTELPIEMAIAAGDTLHVPSNSLPDELVEARVREAQAQAAHKLKEADIRIGEAELNEDELIFVKKEQLQDDAVAIAKEGLPFADSQTRAISVPAPDGVGSYAARSSCSHQVAPPAPDNSRATDEGDGVGRRTLDWAAMQAILSRQM